jgi:hypothetical protein
MTYCIITAQERVETNWEKMREDPPQFLLLPTAVKYTKIAYVI